MCAKTTNASWKSWRLLGNMCGMLMGERQFVFSFHLIYIYGVPIL